MELAAGVRSASRAHPHLVDAAVAVTLFVGGLLALKIGRGSGGGQLGAAQLVLGAVTCLPLAARRRWPAPVAMVTTAGAVAAMVVAAGRSPFVAAAIVAVYTVGTSTGRLTTVATGGAAALVLGGVSAWSEGSLWPEPRTLALVAWTGMAAAVGDAVRNRRDYVAGVVERARRAEQSREEEARRRVAEERLRIARELHDAVAHHIAVVNVQAGVAGHVLTSQPEAAEEALRQIRRATGMVLEELAAMLSVLRESDGPDSPTQPAPGLGQLDELVESFSASGLHITYSMSGRPQPLPPTVGLVTYRIVQESLTNAHKYGDGAVHVDLVHRSGALEIDVRNRTPAPAPAPREGSGHGLLGMRERAAAVGGTLVAGPEPNGQYRVHATLPVRDEGDL
jgi:signal transduction histidine kinase